MRASLRVFVALSAAAAALACAQGRAGVRQSSQAATQAAAQPAQQDATSATPKPTPTPTPSYAPPFPSQKRGGEAFEPVLRMSGGRAFESRSLALRPARKDLELSADYPVLVGDERPAARKFNRLMRDFAAEEMRPLLRDRSDPDDKKDRFEGVPMERQVSHTIVYASDELVSVLFYVTGYTTPAAHGYHYPITFNFDMNAGRALELKDLFNPGSRHLERIAGLCDEDLNRQFREGQLFAFASGREPAAKNYSAWVVTPGGLVFVFEEYQAVAYAGGEPKVLVPFDRLADILRPGGALAALAARPE
ncbi:MAG TPA: RsiV family protein [Pyrinomonadaceae bacterium]|jgi:hypothetical protein|nr:RsiV family protein [Pyrinomonadaceae bacterium]